MKKFKTLLEMGSIADSYHDRLKKCIGKDHLAFQHVHTMMKQSRNISDVEAYDVAHRVTGVKPEGTSKRAALRHLMAFHTAKRHELKETTLDEGRKLRALGKAYRMAKHQDMFPMNRGLYQRGKLPRTLTYGAAGAAVGAATGNAVKGAIVGAATGAAVTAANRARLTRKWYKHYMKNEEFRNLTEGEKMDALKLAWKQHKAIQRNYVHGNEKNPFKRAVKNAAYYGKYPVMAGALHGVVHAGTGSHKLAALQTGAFVASNLMVHGKTMHDKYKKNLINARRLKAKREGRWPVKEE